jgi:alkylation response protein AidB-like acyl-CoA dehydrogenase
MDLNPSPEHELLRSTVRAFAEAEIRPAAAALDDAEEFSVDLTRRMGDLGLFGVVVPEEYGGQGMDYLAYVIAVEEVARVDGSQAATVTAANSLGIGPLYYFGTEDQKRRFLPALCRGESLWAFGLTEPDAGSDSRGTRTTATPDGDDWTINGSKIFITNGSTPITAGATVQTVTSWGMKQPAFTCFIVEQDTPGFSATPMHGKLMWRGSDTAELHFDDVRVPGANILGEIGAGSSQMLETLDSGRLGIAAMGLGAAQGAFELALEYAKTREQFGRQIGKFQAIAFKLADMATKIEHARAFLYRAAWLRDEGRPFTKEAAMAKLYCSEIAKEVADEAVQIHGGYGLMKEYEVERFYRDQRLLQIGEGTSEIQRLVISRQLGL